MKRVSLLCMLLFVTLYAHAQFHINGSSKTFGQEVFAAGFSPYMMIPVQNSNLYQSTYGANLMLGYGILDQLEVHMKFGGLWAKTVSAGEDDKGKMRYYTEFSTKFQPYTYGGKEGPGFATSIELGIHSWQTLAGFDGRVNLTFRANKTFYAYAGFDADYNVENEKKEGIIERKFALYYWAPIGVEIRPYDNLSLIAEAVVPLSSGAAYYSGLGVVYLLNESN